MKKADVRRILMDCSLIVDAVTCGRIPCTVLSTQNPLYVSVDPSDLRRIMINLVIDAVDCVSSEDGTSIFLISCPVADPVDTCTICGKEIRGKHVLIQKTDNLPPFVFKRGFHIISTLIHRAGGHVSISSRCGLTTLRLYLPLPPEG
jgi:hypothetical protein